MREYRKIIPRGVVPRGFEMSAVDILIGYFGCDIEFLMTGSSKTPDIRVGNVLWEIKSPEGKGKNNIQHQFHRGMKQSSNMIIDARRSKMDVRKIRRELKRQAQMTRGLKRLVFITKEEKIEVIK